MAKALPYFRWYPADAEADARYASLTLAELGLYHRCLNFSWTNGGLPENPGEIGRVLRIPVREFLRLWPAVSKCFTLASNGLLFNKRQEEERDKALTKAEKNRGAAKSRWDSDANAMQTHMQTQCERIENALPRAYDSDSVDTSLSVITSIEEKKNQKKDEIENWFDSEFWPVYPLHKARKDALKAARKQLSAESERERAMAALRSQLPELTSRPPDKRPYAATWINGQRWEDEVTPLFASPHSVSGGFVESVTRVMQDRIARGENPL